MKLHSTPNRNASLAKANLVLEAFTEETPELGVMDLARRVGLNKSTASRFVSTLVQLGLLERTESGRKLRLSLRLFEIGMLAARNRPLVIEAKPLLRKLLEETGETVWLGLPLAGQVTFVAVLEAAGDSARIEPGRAYQPGSVVLRQLCSGDPPTESDRGASHGRGDIALDRGETIAETLLEIAPVFARTGAMVGALGIAPADDASNPTQRHDLLLGAASQLSLRLGFARAMRVASASPDYRAAQKIA